VLFVCLKLEATPCKHMHVSQIFRDRLTTACCKLAGCLGWKRFKTATVQWAVIAPVSPPVRVMKLPHYYAVCYELPYSATRSLGVQIKVVLH